MAPDPRRARDLALLDSVDAFPRQPFTGTVWRVSREDRDPVLAGRSPSRWCNGTFDVLYTSLERNGALAEIHALLSSQPVFPSKLRFFVHRIAVRAERTLRLAELDTLQRLGVDIGRYRERDYRRCQEIADAAYFLGFDGLIVPTARWSCLDLVLFTDRVPPENLELADSETNPVDWSDWRKRQGRRGA